MHKSLFKAPTIYLCPNPNLKEETLCEKPTSQEASGLQSARMEGEGSNRRWPPLKLAEKHPSFYGGRARARETKGNEKMKLKQEENT